MVGKPTLQPISVPADFEAARSALPEEVVIIARWQDEHSSDITIQDFVAEGRSFIPVFTDEMNFDSQIKGSGFEDQGVLIRTDVFLSILRGGELLIVNPGGKNPLSIALPSR